MLTLLAGYGGYYLCRSNLAVIAPLLVTAFHSHGIDKEAIGLIASAGVFFYAIGKLVNGIICDFVGGRTVFLLGMLGSAACTVMFGLAGGLSAFVIMWSLNRLIQSAGWSALVKVAARWFPAHRHGTVMGVLSLSFLFGDAFARMLLGGLIAAGVGWRAVCFAAAATLVSIAVVSRWTLKASPADVGLPEPQTGGASVYGDDGERVQPRTLGDLLRPFVNDPSFWLICGLSLGLTLIREALTLWTPTYLTEAARLSPGAAAVASTVFPLLGGASALAIGYLTDRVGARHRITLLIPFVAGLVAMLLVLSRYTQTVSLPVTLTMLGAISFLLIGPYSLLAGVVALDLGGKKGSATAAGLFDSAGYFGSVVSGYGIAVIAQRRGWATAFDALSAVAACTLLITLLYWVRQRTAARRR